MPCFAISPWSKGGYVNSQVFDHTSLIRFIEAVFGPRVRGGLTEPNITPWRAAVCGDLTTCFNFQTPNAAKVQLPSTTTYAPPNGNRQTVGYVPVPPAAQALPKQEQGARRARALPYEMRALSVTNAKAVLIAFTTTGSQTVVFLVRSTNPTFGQRSYTVEPSKRLVGAWAHAGGVYDLTVAGPNGFLRRFAGNVTLGGTGLEVAESYDKASLTIDVTLHNANAVGVSVLVTDAYTGKAVAFALTPGQTTVRVFALAATHGWYDLTITLPGYRSFVVQLAGHLENGAESQTDPMIS